MSNAFICKFSLCTFHMDIFSTSAAISMYVRIIVKFCRYSGRFLFKYL